MELAEKKINNSKWRYKKLKKLKKGLSKRFDMFDIVDFKNEIIVTNRKDVCFHITKNDIEAYYNRCAESGYGIAFFFIEHKVIETYLKLKYGGGKE